MDIVTGAFSYAGKYIARHLLARGRSVKTLTGHPHRTDPFECRVPASLLDLADPDRLRETLAEADPPYNTYWVRFAHGDISHDLAVRNTTLLFQAVRDSGVRRIAHISITGEDAASPLPCFRG